jgi:hypothetical protein
MSAGAFETCPRLSQARPGMKSRSISSMLVEPSLSEKSDSMAVKLGPASSQSPP